MRITFFAILLFSLGCSKTEPASETETQSEAAPALAATAEAPAAEAPPTPKSPPATPALPPETKPVVKLLTAGEPPLEALRRTFKAGQKETMTLEVGEVITMKGGGWDALSTPLALRQTIEIETASVSDDGTAEVTLRVVGAEEVEGTSEKPNTKQMNPTGVTGRYQIDARGVMTGLDLEPPPNNLSVAKPFLDSMRSKLRAMAPPFPEEPVGVGAKWTVRSEVNEFITHLSEEVTVELVKATGSELVLRFEVSSKGTRHHDFTPPQDIAVDVQSSGKATLQLDALVPASSELSQQIVQTATIEGVDEKVVQTLKHTVKIRAK